MAIKIKRESGFLMKSKLEIECALAEEMQHLEDPNRPMDEMDWAHNRGWVEALEFVLYNKEERIEKDTETKRVQDIGLTDIERNDIIARSIKKLQHENQSLIDDEDSEPCGLCTCGVE